jgi:hypothetical protein
LNRRARLAIVAVFPVAFDLDVQIFALQLNLRTFLLSVHEVRTEEIQLAIERQHLVHEIFIHWTVHLFTLRDLALTHVPCLQQQEEWLMVNTKGRPDNSS